MERRHQSIRHYLPGERPGSGGVDAQIQQLQHEAFVQDWLNTHNPRTFDKLARRIPLLANTKAIAKHFRSLEHVINAGGFAVYCASPVYDDRNTPRHELEAVTNFGAFLRDRIYTPAGFDLHAIIARIEASGNPLRELKRLDPIEQAAVRVEYELREIQHNAAEALGADFR